MLHPLGALQHPCSSAPRRSVHRRTRPRPDPRPDPPREQLPRKRVRWSTITIHEFGVGLGGSAVSERGGPSIGLAETPEFTWSTNVGEMAECCEGVHRFSPEQRRELLVNAGVPSAIVCRYARETNIILSSRRCTAQEEHERWMRGVYEREEESDEDEEEDTTEDEEENDDGEDEQRPVHVPMASRKRKAGFEACTARVLEPHQFECQRPHMIPANYV